MVSAIQTGINRRGKFYFLRERMRGERWRMRKERERGKEEEERYREMWEEQERSWRREGRGRKKGDEEEEDGRATAGRAFSPLYQQCTSL